MIIAIDAPTWFVFLCGMVLLLWVVNRLLDMLNWALHRYLKYRRDKVVEKLALVHYNLKRLPGETIEQLRARLACILRTPAGFAAPFGVPVARHNDADEVERKAR